MGAQQFCKNTSIVIDTGANRLLFRLCSINLCIKKIPDNFKKHDFYCCPFYAGASIIHLAFWKYGDRQ